MRPRFVVVRIFAKPIDKLSCEGKNYFVEQGEMDLYRPSAEHTEQLQVMFYIVLMAYDDGYYTKEVHEAVLAEEEAERRKK